MGVPSLPPDHPMNIAFWVYVYIAAAVQAALLALALWRRPANREANRLLAVWVALAGVDLAVKAAYWHTLAPEWFRAYRFVALFPFLYGSLFFLYVRALTRGRGFRWRDVRHLLGFAAMLLATGHVLLASPARLQAMSAHWIAGERAIGRWFDIALFVYSLSYVAAALVQVHRYRRRLRERRSDADRLSLRWIDTMAACQVVIWCIAIVQALVYLPILNYGLLFGAIAGWIFVMGWFSLNQSPVAVEPEVAAAPAGDGDEVSVAAAGPDDARFDAVQARVAALMDGAAPLFLEPALTIGQVAKRSGYPEYLVSAVINRRFGGTFWDYVNRLRVEAARACLADAGDARSILDIAYACGFTSKSTFNAAFKRQIGDTPSAYRKAQALTAPAGRAGPG
ncbi:helix-turn-helix transcriptional regulator [Fulvimonas sp. R45]|uniref:helix-turn-helix domain-containing protein n=1 Tax=Fulvimonas sp. R45 TaxID=3045937 RepID=UPI00265E8FCB|nr:helix-turn-helix transcriptional regulator [Fulvimonas sp. R45]MDO1530136.1 helix-turn-helix transcriptional regulator [Fulvimonas sp. R45]